MNILFILLVLTTGCVSRQWHQRELESVRLQEIHNCMHLADLVVQEEIDPHHMIKFLEERKTK